MKSLRPNKLPAPSAVRGLIVYGTLKAFAGTGLRPWMSWRTEARTDKKIPARGRDKADSLRNRRRRQISG